MKSRKCALIPYFFPNPHCDTSFLGFLEAAAYVICQKGRSATAVPYSLKYKLKIVESKNEAAKIYDWRVCSLQRGVANC